jgi:hypothetical protein
MLLVERVEHHYVRAVSIAVINDYEIEWGNAFNIRLQSNVMNMKTEGRNSILCEKKCAFFHNVCFGIEDLLSI